MRNKKYVSLFFFAGVALLYFIFQFISNLNTSKSKAEILSNSLFVNGVVDGGEQKYKDAFRIKYHFIFLGKRYDQKQSEINNSSFFADKYLKMQNTLIGKSFPIIINKKKPEMNQMLILPEDFEFYNIPFPDSLQWVKEKLLGE
jgi:hypothetical protein